MYVLVMHTVYFFLCVLQHFSCGYQLLDNDILDANMARGNKGANSSGGSHLNELQHACITKNYRAAKAIFGSEEALALT